MLLLLYMLFLCFTPGLPLAIYVTAVIMLTWNIYIYTPSSYLYICFIPASLLLYFNVYICVHMIYSCMLTLKYVGLFMLHLWFTPALPLLICVTAVLLFHLHIFIYTPTLLVLYSFFSWCVCVCVCAGLVECVEQLEGLRRDGAWEHGVLQQRAAGEAPLHEPPHVCLWCMSVLRRHVLACRSVSVCHLRRR